MKIQDLLQLLSGYPPEAELDILLSANGTEARITELQAGFSVARGCDEILPKNAVSVSLYEPEPEGEPFFDEQLRLGIPDELIDLCAEHKLKPQEVLHGFIADLCEIRNPASAPRPDGLSSHGSDERNMAWAWFDRAGYTWRKSGEAA
jgi:hypothetical protein